MGLLTKNTKIKKTEPAKKDSPFQTDLKKLKLLVTVVSRNKSEFYMDYLSGFDINMQTAVAAQGTAPSDALYLLGLADSDKRRNNEKVQNSANNVFKKRCNRRNICNAWSILKTRR